MEMEEYDLCEHAYKKALELGGEADIFEYLKDFIYILYLNEKSDKAIEKVKESLYEWNNHPHLLVMLAGLLYDTGRTAQADDALEFAMGFDPESYEVLFEYFDELENNAHILDIISRYRN